MQRDFAVLRNLAGLVVVILVAAISFAAFYLNMNAAKRRVLVWRRGSTYMFIRSNGMGGVQRRARHVWMERLGYDEPEAMIISNYQWRARFMGMAGCGILFAIATAIFQYFDKG